MLGWSNFEHYSLDNFQKSGCRFGNKFGGRFIRSNSDNQKILFAAGRGRFLGVGRHRHRRHLESFCGWQIYLCDFIVSDLYAYFRFDYNNCFIYKKKEYNKKCSFSN